MSSISDKIGLGVTIALTDAFTQNAKKVSSFFGKMKNEFVAGGLRVGQVLDTMKVGLAATGVGTGILAALTNIGKRAIEESGRIGSLRRAITGMAHDGGKLWEQLGEMAKQKDMSFTRDELAGGAKQLEKMGIAAEKIPGFLKSAATAAAGANAPLGEYTTKFARLNNMLLNPKANPAALLSRMGITLADMAAQGIKSSAGKLKGSAEEVMAGVQRVIQARFGESAAAAAGSPTVLKKKIAAEIAEAYAAAGDAGLKEIHKSILGGFLDILQSGAKEIGKAFGEGLSFVMSLLAPIGRGLRDAAKALVKFLAEHPAIVRIGTAIAGIVGIVLMVGGAFITLGAAVKLLPLAFEVLGGRIKIAFASSYAAIAPMLPMLIAVGALAYLAYRIWNDNIGGIRDTLTSWWESTKLVVMGLYELFTSTSAGHVGAIPTALRVQLMDRGLWPLVQAIYVWGERVIDFFRGVGKGIGAAFQTVLFVLQPFLTILSTVGRIVGWLAGVLLGWMGDAGRVAGGNKAMSETFRDTGRVIGFLVGVIGIAIMVSKVYHGVVTTIEGVTKAWKGAQLALNTAMIANPLGVIIVGVGLLIVGIVALIAYYDKLILASLEWSQQARKSGFGPSLGKEMDDALDKDIERRRAEQEQLKREGKDGFTSRLFRGASQISGMSLPKGMDVDEEAKADYARTHSVSFNQEQAMAGMGTGARGAGGTVTAGGETDGQKIEINLNVDGDRMTKVVVDKNRAIQEREDGAAP